MPEHEEFEEVEVEQGGEVVRIRRLKQTQRVAEEAKRELEANKQEKLRVAAETNALELDQGERELQSALQLDKTYLRIPSGQQVYIRDILDNYRKLRRALDALAVGELWPCLLTQSEGSPRFSAPLDVPPALAAMLVAELRTASTEELPFPSAPADPLQFAVNGKVEEKLKRAQPFFIRAAAKLLGLPAKNAEAGFIRGAKLDTDLRVPFSPPQPPDQEHEPPRARLAVSTAKPNLTVVYTHGYFSSVYQLGVSTPASGSVAYGWYRFGIEVKGFHFFQESLVSVPDQLKVSLDLVPRE
jgi:hypothetical protein